MRTLKEVDDLRQRLMAEACCGWLYVSGAWGEERTPSNRRRRCYHDSFLINKRIQRQRRNLMEGCRHDQSNRSLRAVPGCL